MRRGILFAAACMLVVFAASLAFSTEFRTLAASVPAGSVASGVNYQGRLIDNGFPVTGTRTMTFRLYNAPNGGTLLWNSGAQGVQVTQGIFGTTLAISTTALSGAGQKYLEVQIETTTLSPREPLNSVPYALVARALEDNLNISTVTVGGTLISSGSLSATVITTIDGSNGITVSSRAFFMNGNVGLGTVLPAALLEVQSSAVPTYAAIVSTGAAAAQRMLSVGTSGEVAFNGNLTRAGNANYGTQAYTYVNLASSGTAGTNGQNYLNATVGGGLNNTASNQYATISGGHNNGATGDSSAVLGGNQNLAGGAFSAVGGGSLNVSTGSASAVGGGSSNAAGADFGTIGGGINNVVAATWATVGGGVGNTASGVRAVVAGGVFNAATADRSSIVGGGNNTASGLAATVIGGSGNTASGTSSLAGGTNAAANAAGSFVWADSSGSGETSGTADQFLVLAQGGFRVRAAYAAFVDGSTLMTVDSSSVDVKVPISGASTITAGTSLLGPALTTFSPAAVTFTGDTNTGMSAPAADTLAFGTGGTERLRIGSTGNVGIGTAGNAAGDKLEVASGNLRLKQTAGSSGSVKLFSILTVLGTDTCTAICGANTVCLGAWTSAGVSSTCGTTVAANRCLCAGFGD
ncbi:MAG: hypothetical protein HY059_09110 [Proteobacteria bacterium]|nr:hypothetical protein [Pseudomonadota bacterium]